MSSTSHRFRQFTGSDSLYPARDKAFRRGDAVALILGLTAVVVLHGLMQTSGIVQVELGLTAVVAATYLPISLALRFHWSLARTSFLRSNTVAIAIAGMWILAIVFFLVFTPLLEGWTRFEAFVLASQVAVASRAATSLVIFIRRATAGTTDPAVILVSSFAVLIAVGTGLLLLPRAHAGGTGAPFDVAFFTATSASCVTGLVVEHTGGYWSAFGQTIILALFQIGGLGIMTCGAFFAVAAGRHMQIRESATLRDMLESEQLGDVRRLVLTILAFTATVELLGAVAISGLWADLPTGERIRYSLFHAVSAFCNAGFSLTENSFVGMGERWQVWGATTGMIVVGGMGFAVLYNLALWLRSRVGRIAVAPLFHLPKERVRLSLTTKLAAGTTIVLLVAGAGMYDVLEAVGGASDREPGVRAAEAWFQSVTFRTAGFNTVNHTSLQPSTKLFAILLMFVGASPGSTGGGVKTVCFAISVLALLSILRGRPNVEIAGRTIPQDLVNRALAIISLGIVVVMTTTLLLVLFEPQSDTRFLDYLMEATSAFGTVGVSAGVTPGLSTPSRFVIIATMFVGRVGPLTLLIALAGRHGHAQYDYPVERVALG